jgi:(E)-4-hydroxy-3-methylbut-2-enyl-diphosphate synthase
LNFDPFNYTRRKTFQVGNIGSKNVPVVIADYNKHSELQPNDLKEIGYHYDEVTDKWTIADTAADYIFCKKEPDFKLPGTLNVLLNYSDWLLASDKEKCNPLFTDAEYLNDACSKSSTLNFVMIDCYSEGCNADITQAVFEKLKTEEDYQPIISIIRSLVLAEVYAPSQGTKNGGNIRLNFNNFLRNI